MGIFLAPSVFSSDTNSRFRSTGVRRSIKGVRMTRTKFALWGLVLAGAIASQTAGASVTLLEKDGWAMKFSGFVEFDAIWDTTRTYTEVQGNAPIALNTGINGEFGRGQFSLRNSRLAFGVEAPEACGFHT